MGSVGDGVEEKGVETVVVGTYVEMESDEKPSTVKSKLSMFLWHGGSTYDAWFSLLLTLPYSFSQLGMLSGIIFQLLYGLLGSWTAYLISILEGRLQNHVIQVNLFSPFPRSPPATPSAKLSPLSPPFLNLQWFEVLDGLLGKHWRNLGLAFNCTFLLFGSVIQLIACASNIYYINDKLDKRTWTYIFGACCATTVFIPSFRNYRIWSFLVEGVKHSGPTKLVLYFTGATNILYTFGGHAVTVEIMHAMWKPQKFKAIYLLATAYVLTLTLPSAVSVYWAFGDQLITFGFACTPLYFVWEKAIGLHECRSMVKRAAARLPVVVPIWFLAIIFPFFGPINSAVGSLLVSFTVYIIPAVAHMVTFRSAAAREVLGRWAGAYTINAFVVIWVLIVGFGFGGWASITNFVRQVDNFGLFAKCYQCPPPAIPPVPGLPIPTFLPNATAPTIAPSPSPSLGLRHHHHHHHHSP
ncbi:unnamed protein product [Spirodela intermedia]|uniref:Amino acid transporter transmembrane domain-containing protein n=1 Tax=Spirodela intermedia TaxID=51605 RepID=A0A7I8IDV5_SPIIN|nr:unnamed protein product [Spirodela intermedia]CAA6655968.1 unnamed protein product [Spirodela intermedia]